MKTPAVVHCKRQPYDIYVGRPSKWGNPFTLENHTRDEAIDLYAEWIRTQTSLMLSLDELRGKILACWCHPKPCHADVLLHLANSWETCPEETFCDRTDQDQGDTP